MIPNTIQLGVDSFLACMTPLARGDAVAAGVTSLAMAGLGFMGSALVFRAMPPRLHGRVAIIVGAVAIVAIAG